MVGGLEYLSDFILNNANDFVHSVKQVLVKDPLVRGFANWWQKVYRPDLLLPKKPFDKHANHKHWKEMNTSVPAYAKEENKTINTTKPTVGIPFAEFSVPDDIWNVFYGFMNGIIDVFPDQSLPQFCRSNITQTYWQSYRIFVDWQYNLAN